MNSEIRDREVRLVGPDGEQLGILSSLQALKMAENKNLDLVKIAPGAVPPVCKIMDYGKFKFDQAKKEKENRKTQHVTETKELRLSINIGEHDLETKVGHVQKFTEKGDKVKISMRLRGREMGNPKVGCDTMERFAYMCSNFADVEKAPKLEGRQILMFLIPKKIQKNK